MNEEATASSCLNVATGLTSYQIYYNGRTQYSKSFFGYIQRHIVRITPSLEEGRRFTRRHRSFIIIIIIIIIIVVIKRVPFDHLRLLL